MSRESLILLLGMAIFFAPTLGIPEQWKMYIISGSGVALMIIGYSLRRTAYLRSIERDNGTRETDSFVESGRRPDNYASEQEIE